MDSMDSTARNGRAAPARLLALLAVLVGLLAMHGLASSHHSPASAAGRPSGPAERHVAAAVQAPDVPLAPARHGEAAGSSAQQPTGPLAVPSGSSCATDCVPGLVALCVAVLATAVVVATAVLLRDRARHWGSRPALGTARAPTAARFDLPPPDPVRELCVSRT